MQTQVFTADSSLFSTEKREFFHGTPYFLTEIRINTLKQTIPVKLIVNSLTGQVNLNKLFQDLQDGANAHYKYFIDFKYLRGVMAYTDAYSLLRYGHVHYTYNGKNIYGITDDEFIRTNQTNLKIHPDLLNKGKVVKASLLQEAPEVFGEQYNGMPNDCKGLYGDYHLISKMMSYISPIYEVINNEFIAYVLPILSTKNETLITTLQDPSHELISKTNRFQTVKTGLKEIISDTKEKDVDIDDIDFNGLDDLIIDFGDAQTCDSKRVFTSKTATAPPWKVDKTLLDIMKIDNTSKGVLAEQWTLEYFKNYIPDIESCSHKPESCDLISNSLKLRIEIKCHNTVESAKSGINKFHRDCHVNMNNTNLFVYLDISPISTIITHFEINPLRFYINGKDLNKYITQLMVYTAKTYNTTHIIEDVTDISSNLLLKDTRILFREALQKELPILLQEFSIPIFQDEPPENIERIKGRLSRMKEHENTIKRFFDAEHDRFVVGYYKSKTYLLYKDWCKQNSIQHLRYEEFNSLFKSYCVDVRITPDPINPSDTQKHRFWRIPLH